MRDSDFQAPIAKARAAVVAVHGRQRTPSSGIYWQEGIVVTAEHTLKRDDDLHLTLPDLTTVDATLVGRDAGTDVAVLKTTAQLAPLVHAATAPAIGQWVLALGMSPDDGIGATLGIVSGVGGPWRTWRGGQVDAFLRPDLTLYPGFAGGPLLTTDGELLGLNSSALSRSMNLTIPTSTLVRVVHDLVEKGRVSRGYLGVGMHPIHISARLQKRLGLSHASGVIVLSVEDDSPADRSGIVVGDILMALEGKPIQETEDVLALLGAEAIGNSLSTVLIRGGERQEITLQVGERPGPHVS